MERRVSALSDHPQPQTSSRPASQSRMGLARVAEENGRLQQFNYSIEINIGAKEVLHLGHAQELW